MDTIGTGIEDQSHHGFWALWEVHRGRLMNYCLSLMGGSEEDAKDALSGTLLKALDAWDVNRDRLDNPVGWLFRIAHNHCMDQFREARNRYRSEADPDELSIRNRDLHPDLPESPEETFLRREMHVNLEDALARLPEKLREVMILRCVKEYSYQEISDELNISPVNVRKRVQLGREWMRKSLDGYLKEDQGALPQDALAPGDGEKNLAESVVTDPFKDLFPRRNHCKPVQIRNRKNEILDSIAISQLPGKRLEQKIKSAEKYIRKYPTGWKKRSDLAELYFLSGRWEESLEQTAIVLNKNPRMLEPRMLRSRILWQQGEKRKAADEIREVISTNRKPVIRYFLEGTVALINRQYAMAVRAFRKATQAAPQQIVFKEFLGRSLLEMGDPAKATSILNSIPSEEAGAITLMLRYKAARDLGADFRAKHLLTELLDSFPEFLPALEEQVANRLQLGMVYGKEGTETRSKIRSLEKQAPKASISSAFQAEYHFLRGKNEKSLEILSQFRKSHPHSLSGRYHLARMHFLLGNKREALLELTGTPGMQSGRYWQPALLDLLLENHFDRTTSHLESHSDWELLGARAWLQACHWHEEKKAVSSGEAMVEFRSGWPATWYRKGWLDLIAGRLPESKSAWVQAWDLLPDGEGNPMRASISKGMILLHLLQKEEKEAISWANRLENWLPLIETEATHLFKALKFNLSHQSPTAFLRFHPEMYFLRHLPGVWMHDLPLL